MRIQLFLLLAGSAFAHVASAQAQPDLTYDGKWSATIVTSGGKREGSRLTITRFSGIWHGKVGVADHSKKPCNGAKFPVTVQTSNDTNLDFTVWGSQVSPACRDLTVQLTPTGNDVFDGTVQSVGTIHLGRLR